MSNLIRKDGGNNFRGRKIPGSSSNIIEQNRTKIQSNSIERLVFVWQLNSYFAVSSIFEPMEPIEAIEQNRINPMQFCSNAGVS